MVGSLNWIRRRDGHGDDFLYVKKPYPPPPKNTKSEQTDLNPSYIRDLVPYKHICGHTEVS